MQVQAEANRIKDREATEKERHNRADEKITKRGQVISAVTSLLPNTSFKFSKALGIKKGVNDVQWYSKFSDLVERAGRINAAIPAGIPQNYVFSWIENSAFDTHYYPGNVNIAPTGVGVIDYYPTIGAGATGVDTAADIAQRVYTYVRHVNSGHSNYDPTELLFYILGVSSLYEYYALMCRWYRIIQTYNVNNRTTPLLVGAADGINVVSLIHNLADFKYYIDNFKHRISAFALPGDMSLVARRVFLNSNVFKDRDSDKAQLYLYRPTHMLKYKWNTTGTVRSQLEYVALPARTGGINLNDITTFGDALIEALYYNEDIGIMSGDMLKAYNDTIIGPLENLPDDATLELVYNEDVLEQLHNTRLSGLDVTAGTVIDQTVTPNVGKTLVLPDYWANAAAALSYENGSLACCGKLRADSSVRLDFYKKDINSGDAMEFTRNVYTCECDDDSYTPTLVSSTWRSKITSCGSEVFTTFQIVYAYRNNNSTQIQIGSTIHLSENNINYYLDPSGVLDPGLVLPFESQTWLHVMLTLLPTFNKHPFIGFGFNLMGTDTTSGDKAQVSYIAFWETNNYTRVSTNVLNNLHYAALFSELLPSKTLSFLSR